MDSGHNGYYRRNIRSDDVFMDRRDEPKSSFWKWQPNPDCTCMKILQESNIHGMKYIAQPNRHVFERMFWGVTLLISLSVALYMTHGVLEKYNLSPVIVSFQPSQTSISQIPFPAVTICNVNRIRKSVIMNALEMIQDDDIDNKTKAQLIFVLKGWDAMCETHKSFSVKFNYGLNEVTVNLYNRTMKIPINLLNSSGMPTVKEAYQNVHQDTFWKGVQRCEEMLLLCMWEGDKRNCSEMFTTVTTNFGYCCTFNMMPRRILLKQKDGDPTISREEQNMSKEELEKWNKFNMDENMFDKDDSWNAEEYPKRQSKAGEGSGLSFMVNPELDEYFCGNHNGFGFRVLTHSPIDIPHVTEFGMAVTPASEVYISIDAEVTVTDKGIQSMSPSKRHCYYTYEHPLQLFKYYTISNCMDECIQNLTRENCLCERFELPHSLGSFPFCTPANGLNCSRKIDEMISKDGIQHVCSNCKPSCNDIDYVPQVSSLKLKNDERMWMKNGSKADWAGKNFSIIHIFFGSENVYARVRTSLYTANDLFAHVGGILGLFLGFSVISAIEPVYFLFRSWFNCDSNEKIEQEIEDSSGETASSLRGREEGARQRLQPEDFVNYYYRHSKNEKASVNRGQFPFLN